MPTITDILSLERARFELRFPEGDTSQDERLEELIASAVRSVMEDVRVPIVDLDVAGIFVIPSPESAIVIRDPWLRSVSAVSYQAETDTPIPLLFDQSAEHYSVNQYSPNITLIRPPNGEWPGAVGNRFRVAGRYGVADNYPSLSSITTAAVLAFRAAYDGVALVKEGDAYSRIISPLRNYAPWGFDIVGLAGDTPGGGDGAITIAAGWSNDTIPQAAELTVTGTGSQLTIPDGTGSLYLVLWRSDAAGGDPEQVHISGARGWRNLLGGASDLGLSGVAGKAIVSVHRQNAALLSGEPVEIV